MLIEVKEAGDDESPGGAAKRPASVTIPVADKNTDQPANTATVTAAPTTATASKRTAPTKTTAPKPKVRKAVGTTSRPVAPQSTRTIDDIQKAKRTVKPAPASATVISAPSPAQAQPQAQPEAQPEAPAEVSPTADSQPATNQEFDTESAATNQSKATDITLDTAADSETGTDDQTNGALEDLAAARDSISTNHDESSTPSIVKMIAPPRQRSTLPTGSSSGGRLAHAWSHTRKRRVLAVLLILFGIYNVGIFAAYRNHTYPNTVINGQVIGAKSGESLAAAINAAPLLPKDMTLHHRDKHHKVSPSDMGMRIDTAQTSRAVLAERSWLPVWNQLHPPQGNTVISVDPKAYERTVQQLASNYRTPATDARIMLRDDDFKLIPQIDAQTIDAAATQAAIVDALSAGRTDAQLHLRSTPPNITTSSLQTSWNKLQAQRNTAISLAASNSNKTHRFTPTKIGSWFVPDGSANSFKLDSKRVSNGVIDGSMELGLTPDQTEAITVQIIDAVTNTKARKLTVNGTAIGKRDYGFCVNVRGLPASEAQKLARKTEATLNDKRSWSLGGNITFKQSTTDCGFTIWLAAADQMSSFGAICDAMWSCAVEPNVIINNDRWNKTTEPWIAAKGKDQLEEYRSMAINHEVGHWLGFGHPSCPAAGSPAPVMQQQSINLQGCTFNAWPTTNERLALKNALGL